jgi:hypothetical protein
MVPFGTLFVMAARFFLARTGTSTPLDNQPCPARNGPQTRSTRRLGPFKGRISRTTMRYKYFHRYDIEVEVVDILIDEASDTITVRVSADLAPLFPDFGLALDHTVVREGEAQVRMRAWMP